jgi:PKD repeat protein
MREGYAPLFISLLLVASSLILVGNPGSIIDDGLVFDAVAGPSPPRGSIEWTDLGNITVSSFLNDTSEIDINFNNQNVTFTASSGYDPYFDHNSTVKAAIDAAPQWLNDTLSWRFSEFWSHPGQKWAELLLNDTIDWRYRDEIAFTIAHLPSQITYSMWVWPELIVENVEMIYKVAEEVPYASLTDVNTSSGLRTTITYKVPGGNVTLPDDIYYENLVMPRNSLENPNYVNRTSKQYTYPDDGWFWRNFLYYEADDGYPILRDMLLNQTTLWNGTRNQAENNGAIGAVTNWELRSMVFGMPDYRSSQPVLAYGEHIGMCGENSYLLTAVAKTALIPTVTVINFDWMHGWNMFYDRGWHIWRAYDGVIDDTYAEGGPGGVNAHASFNPDSSQFNSAYLHTQVANLTVRVVDDKGIPVDGTMVKIFSNGVSNYKFNPGLIGNHTNVNGEARFQLGVGFQYFAQIISPIGTYLDEDAIIPLALPNAVPGVNHWFNVTLNRSMPLKANLSRMYEPEFGLRFNVTINEIDQQTRPEIDAMGYDRWFWKGYGSDQRLPVYLLDEENYDLYLNGSEFFPIAVMNITTSSTSSVIVPDDGEWNIIVPGLANPLTRTFVNFTLEVSRSVVHPEAIIQFPDPGYYLLGEELHFKGELYPYPPYLGEVDYRWFKNDTSDPISESSSFNWTPGLGRYEVTFSVWKEREMIDSDLIVFEILMPNRAPEAMISSPEEGSIFVAGHEILFASFGTNDPDGDLLEYKWTIPSTGSFLSNASSFSRKFIVGDHIVLLNVTDPDGMWSTEEVTFKVIKANTVPTPFIRSPEDFSSHYVDEIITLSANGSYDLDGDLLSYIWESDISGFLSEQMEVYLYLIEGEHKITLTVNDGNMSLSTNVTIYVYARSDPVDLPPVAVINKPTEGQAFYIRDLVEFNSIGSHDPEGHPLDYVWKVDGHNVSTSPGFSMYLKEGIHSISLTVLDMNQSSTSSITVIVTNRAPVLILTLNGTEVSMGSILTLIENETTVFDASGSFDPDETNLMFNWSMDGEVVHTGSIFTTSLTRGYHEIRLTITDEDGRSKSFFSAINSIKGSDPSDPTIPDDDEKKTQPSTALYLIPSILIVVFLIAAIIFFLLSREKKDVYFEE